MTSTSINKRLLMLLPRYFIIVLFFASCGQIIISFALCKGNGLFFFFFNNKHYFISYNSLCEKGRVETINCNISLWIHRNYFKEGDQWEKNQKHSDVMDKLGNQLKNLIHILSDSGLVQIQKNMFQITWKSVHESFPKILVPLWSWK